MIVVWIAASTPAFIAVVGLLILRERLATGVFFLGERIGVATILGGAIILFGIWLINRRQAPVSG